MSYYLDENQVMIRDMAASFARREVEPLANEMDREEQLPPTLTERIADLGLFGLCIGEDYGGSGAGLTSACLALEEIAKASPALAGVLSVQIVLCPLIVSNLGSEEQKRQLLPASANGSRLLAFSQTEPAGSVNYRGHLTRLTRDGDSWKLNGSKLFCSQGECKTYLVICRTEVDGASGFGCVIVDAGAPGFSVGKYEDKMGWRGTNTGPISFDDVLVSPDHILGDPLNAPPGVKEAFLASVMSHSASSLGAAQGMFDKTLKYVKERSLYGAPMSDLSPIHTWLAEVYAKIEACRALLYTSTRLYDDGRDEAKLLAPACKAFICETAFQCCNTLLQMWGGSGIMNSTGINRYFRDARTNTIAEASTEYHLSMITDRLMMSA